jgi:flagellar basal body-associated protein FliL
VLIIVSVLISNLVVKSSLKNAQNVALHDKRTEVKKPDPLAVFTLDEFKLSTADVEEPHFLRVVVSLAYDEKNTQLVMELNARRVQITDVITRLLMSKTKDELDDVDLRDELKEQIREEVNILLQKGEIEQIYLTGFMVT